tara:strand:- start:470 stop:925 length:456 start_codon:yes stop_codon:yes gene_type:complete
MNLTNKDMRYLLFIVLILSGCVSNKQPSVNSSTLLDIDIKDAESIFYQAHDSKWNDPSINPVFDTRAEAQKYAKENSMGGHHSYEVREVDYRYVVRVGFSDFTYSNGSWNDILHTADHFNDAYEYVVEYSSAHSNLVIYDLKTGKSFEETP